MKFWMTIGSLWLAFYGLLTLSMAWTMGLPLVAALGISAVLVAVLWWAWSKDIPAKDLTMRESSWNTPEEEEE